MKIGIVVVVYVEYPRLVFDSIIGDTVHDLTWYIHCHSTDMALERSLVTFCETHRCELRLHRENRGLARSWNDGILSSYRDGNEFTLVVNDDVCFRRDGFDAFFAAVMDRPAFALAFLNGEEPGVDDAPPTIRSQDFACFAFGPLAYLHVGAFDENFFPAYMEDTDYNIRIQTLKLPIIHVTRVLVDHERNKTTKRSPQIKAALEATGHANRRYLQAKWGGSEHGPFYGGQFVSRGCFIPWEDRHHPFGAGYDREDLPPAKPPALQISSIPQREERGAHNDADFVLARQRAISAFVVQAVYRSLLRRDAEPGAIIRYSRDFLTGAGAIASFCDEIRGSLEYARLMGEES